MNKETVLTIAKSFKYCPVLIALLATPVFASPQGTDSTFAFPGATFDVGDGPRSVAKGDLDGDLDLDLAVVSVSKISILLNNSDGNFFNGLLPYPAGHSPADVVLGDLDGHLTLISIWPSPTMGATTSRYC